MTTKIKQAEPERDYSPYSIAELVESYNVLDIVDAEYAGVGNWEQRPILKGRKMAIAKELYRRVFP